MDISYCLSSNESKIIVEMLKVNKTLTTLKTSFKNLDIIYLLSANKEWKSSQHFSFVPEFKSTVKGFLYSLKAFQNQNKHIKIPKYLRHMAS